VELFYSFILGILQGFTEFLPVSSSGHLVLGQALLGFDLPGLAYEVTLHVATAAAVVLTYRKRISVMLASLKPSGTGEAAVTREHRLLVWYLVIGTVPAAVVGVLFKDRVESAFDSPREVCLMLAVTGVILSLSRLGKANPARGLVWWRVLLIGAAQAVALLPGISRSGTTITAALLLGLTPGRAAEFSFLLALPAILGAAVLEFVSEFSQGAPALPGTGVLAVGALSAFLSGFLAIFFLLKTLQSGRFDRFAWYCWAVAAAGLLFI